MPASSLAIAATTALTLLSGVTTRGTEAIWKSNGTVSGTTEIVSLYGASNMPYGGFVQFGTKAMFEGMDSRFVNGLFVTDGTAAGTKEIVPPNGSRSQGLNPAALTAYGAKVLFNGIDTNDNYDLWISDGTSTGTKIVTGTTNLDPRNLKVYANLLYFGSVTRKGLFATNGVTTRLIAGTASLFPEQMNVFNGKLYFVDGQTGYLYMTDGTPTGTKKLIYTGASLDMTVLGKYLVFESRDANNHLDLFLCTGTTAAARQIPNTTGIFDNLIDPNGGGAPLSPELTAFKGSLYFEAQSAKGGFGLWQTNSSAAGTHEVTGIAGTLATGIFPTPQDPDFNGPNFAVLGGLLLFDGAAPGGQAPQFGQTYLWASAGTAATTHALKGIPGAGYSGTLGFDPSNMTTLNLAVP